jgi:hypothetical protein
MMGVGVAENSLLHEHEDYQGFLKTNAINAIITTVFSLIPFIEQNSGVWNQNGLNFSYPLTECILSDTAAMLSASLADK